MNIRVTTIATAVALSLGLSSMPASAQATRTYDGRSASYNEDGTLNVWGAHIDRRAAASDGLGGGIGSVLGGVGNTVGGVVGSVTGAADDVVTGSIGGRRDQAARYGADRQTDRPGAGYGQFDGGPAGY